MLNTGSANVNHLEDFNNEWKSSKCSQSSQCSEEHELPPFNDWEEIETAIDKTQHSKFILSVEYLMEQRTMVFHEEAGGGQCESEKT